MLLLLGRVDRFCFEPPAAKKTAEGHHETCNLALMQVSPANPARGWLDGGMVGVGDSQHLGNEK